jgi:hypothetical protein
MGYVHLLPTFVSHILYAASRFPYPQHTEDGIVPLTVKREHRPFFLSGLALVTFSTSLAYSDTIKVNTALNHEKKKKLWRLQ